MSFPFDVRQYPPRRGDGPIIDAHLHTVRGGTNRSMFRAGRRFGAEYFVVITSLDQIKPLRREFGASVGFNVWLDHAHVDEPQRFAADNRDLVRRAADAGAVCIKFWYKPQFNASAGMYFDDWRLDPVFAAIDEAGLPVLVHIADPDVWWRGRYADATRFESKRFTYRQLTNTLGRYPTIQFAVAHMGGNPEHLDALDGLLDRYRNLWFDTSGTKWVARELSAQPARARAFFLRHADRLMFGTDLVAFKKASFAHHCSRYWVHRYLYEQAGAVRSPIDDPDAPEPVTLVGLDLPDAMLRRLYLANAVAFFRLDERGLF